MACSCSVRHEVAMRGASRKLAAVLVDRLGQCGREVAHARLVVADRQQWHERPSVGALEADARAR